MESFFSFSTLFNLVLTVTWFISGIRDLQGKDPFLDLPFNQYHRDPEYRAMWQKKNGVWEICNAIIFASLQFLGNFPTLSNWARAIALVVDAIYLILYEIWEHSAD